MSKKGVDDYLTEGMYGLRRPKEAERSHFLGTLRERIVIALTVGQVMTDSGIIQLEEALKVHRDTKLLINGQVSHRFLSAEKELANKYHVPYTVVTNEEHETEIGAVLTYDHAIHKENIYIEDDETDKETVEEGRSGSLFSVIKNWFTSS